MQSSDAVLSKHWGTFTVFMAFLVKVLAANFFQTTQVHFVARVQLIRMLSVHH